MSKESECAADKLFNNSSRKCRHNKAGYFLCELWRYCVGEGARRMGVEEEEKHIERCRRQIDAAEGGSRVDDRENGESIAFCEKEIGWNLRSVITWSSDPCLKVVAFIE